MLRRNSPAQINGRGFFALFLLCLVLFPVQAHAEDSSNVEYRFFYMPYRDEYRLDYWNFPGNTIEIFVRYTSPTNVIWERSYYSMTGTYYTTCNGTYDYYFKDSSGNDVASITGLITTQIVNPPCDSYEDGTSVNDLNGSYTQTDTGYLVTWNQHPGATNYDIYVDGQYVGSTPNTSYDLPQPGGSVTIIAKDGENVLAQTDLLVPNPGAASDCSVCDMIKDALACPDWDLYMAAWTDAIAAAIPPPPDWEQVSQIFATTFITALDDWMGDMPDTPTFNDIYDEFEPLPEIDTSFPAAEDLTPQLPQDYDNPIDFDITQGEQIIITDESKPFDILDPLYNVEYSDPGEYVLPGDPENNTGGIKLPDSLSLPMPTPKQIILDDDFDYPAPTYESQTSEG